MKPPTPAQIVRLEEFLASPERPAGTLTLGELRGFLFTLASAPELVPFSEAFEFLFPGEDSGLESLEHANEIFGTIAGLYNQINEGVLAGRPIPPADLAMGDQATSNFEPSGPVSQWARGFVTGHNWLEESWDLDLPEEMEDELTAVLMVLSFFASRERADDFAAEGEPDEATEVLAGKCAPMFADAMASYASMGRSLYLAMTEVEGRLPVRSDPVPGRNDPCPCGSGRKYKRCCGASLH